jgi:spermidine/putrescine transport system permease protein
MWLLVKRELSFFLAVPALVWQLLCVCFPLMLTLYTSLHTTVPGQPWYACTLEYYGSFFTAAYGIIIMHSLLLAGVTTLICLCIGYPVAYFLALYAGRWRTILLFLLTLPFWTNFLTQAYAWFFVLEKEGLINTILMKLHVITEPHTLAYNRFAVLCVMVYCFLPFMIMPIYSVLQKLDWRLLEASEDLGATRWQTFLHITLPLSHVGIRTGLLLVFIPACGEFVIPMVMGGSRYMYIGSAITHYLLNVRNEQMGAVCTVVSCLLLVVCIVFARFFVRLLQYMKQRR